MHKLLLPPVLIANDKVSVLLPVVACAALPRSFHAAAKHPASTSRVRRQKLAPPRHPALDYSLYFALPERAQLDLSLQPSRFPKHRALNRPRADFAKLQRKDPRQTPRSVAAHFRSNVR